MAKGTVIRRTAAQATGASVGPGGSRGKVELKLPEEGSLNIRRAENGVIVTVWDSSKKYDDPDHERTFVVDSISDITIK